MLSFFTSEAKKEPSSLLTTVRNTLTFIYLSLLFFLREAGCHKEIQNMKSYYQGTPAQP